jgi:hypothetical protein
MGKKEMTRIWFFGRGKSERKENGKKGATQIGFCGRDKM